MAKWFRAVVVEQQDDQVISELKEMSFEDLPEGEVTIQVLYSSVNYKDGLASQSGNRIIERYPMVPGIDLAGIVVTSHDLSLQAGQPVIVTGFGLGTSHFGGYSQFARVPAEWVVPLPSGLTLEEAMVLGTAGFTAALSIQRLEENGLTPEKGAVLVTGATGGVGSLAVMMLSKQGYSVTASTGKRDQKGYLRELGAKQVIQRNELNGENAPPLGEQRWAGAIDPVGGSSLGVVISGLKYGGSVAVSGLTGGTDVQTTVFPFILRAVNVLGIDSVYCPLPERIKLWERIGKSLKPHHLSTISRTIGLAELPEYLHEVRRGKALGRTVVKL